ncbi:outer membrane beta-barrel protein [Candidatus Fonsibacter ubiquis]|uniref:outer membrane beta-barrel protein n=1 Tax=Candidatus Fonsibacter ubiquis TaxID=1925548 RepID=UPI000C078243|nr:outer membrane beta-barrel protein [Candidatus Fonsibacter ubiquis]
MNKTKTLLATTILATSFSTAAYSQNINVGISGAFGKMDAEGTETNVTAKAKKSGDANFPFASIFAEYNLVVDKSLTMVLGLDYVPLSTEIEDTSRADTNLGGGGAGSGSNPTTTSTKKAKLELENHATLYLQPTYSLGGGLSVFGKVGYSHADLQVTSNNAATGSTLNKKDDLEGYLVGVGVQKNIDKSTFVRFEANYTDYDTVTYTNSNGTRFTADPKLYAAKISVGKSF